MRLLHSIARRQDGVALPLVMSALALTATLATATLAVSIDGQQTSAADRNGKQARAAAQAAVDLGFLRLSTVKPQNGQCVTNAAVAPTAGECPEYTEPPASTMNLGNGATMKYVVSTAGAAGCGVLPNDPPARDKTLDRCITGTGIVNGVSRRLQQRVIFRAGFMPWLNAGLVAKERVEMKNSGNWFTTVGTNGQMVTGNSVTVTGQVQVGPTGSWSYGNSTTITGGSVMLPTPWQFPEVDFAPSRSTNNNAVLSPTVYTNLPAAPRRFYMGNSVEYTLPGGTYNFCSFTMTNSNKLRIPNGQVARIYIDSPIDSASGCTGPGAGKVDVNNSATINEEFGNKNPTQLEIYVRGTAGDSMDTPDVDFKNSSKFWGTIYAPNSTIYQKNSSEMGGGMVGKVIEFKNSSGFTWDDRIKNKTLDGGGVVERIGWNECQSVKPVAADNESGCI